MKNISLFLVLVLMVVSGCGQKENASQKQPQYSGPSAPIALNSPAGTGSSKALMQKAVEFLNQRDATKAIVALNQAVQENPNDPEPLLVLAELYMRLNNYPGAVGYFEKAVQLDPANGQAFYLLGLCYGLAGKMDLAQKAVERSALIFQQKRDEANFRRSVAALQQMMESQAAVSSTVALPASAANLGEAGPKVQDQTNKAMGK